MEEAAFQPTIVVGSSVAVDKAEEIGFALSMPIREICKEGGGSGVDASPGITLLSPPRDFH
jgi:hypothetical protein